jgi:glycosyltransferase involved in cell wall biosynthesis
MRILYHHRTASRDGQAVHIDEMVHALRSLGHEVRVVAPQAAPSEGMGGNVGWVHRLRARLPRALYEIAELAYTAVSYRALAQAEREFKPDAIYERYNLHLLAGWLLKRRTGLPLLLEVNSPLAEERQAHGGGLALPALARWAESRAWRGADVVLPVTQVLAGHVHAAGVVAERIVVIPNGINESHFAAAPTPDAAKAALGWPGALVLGFTGFVREWHGVDRVLRWLASPAAPPHARLLMVGDGPARAELEALAQALGLTDRVRFTGVVPRNVVPALVAAFDIALQPAVVAYASPLKLFEYLALGKAVLAPRTPNIQEVLSHDDNALLFDPAAAGEFEAALGRLADDAALRKRLATRARATITEQGLTWRANAGRVAALAAALAAGESLAMARRAAERSLAESARGAPPRPAGPSASPASQPCAAVVRGA